AEPDEIQPTFDGKGDPTFSFKIQHFIDRVGDKCLLRIRPKTKDDANPSFWAIGLPLFRKYCARVADPDGG
ncbi:hypothetical protein AAVH_38290, partial [Aphelenchoides avenae]